MNSAPYKRNNLGPAWNMEQPEQSQQIAIKSSDDLPQALTTDGNISIKFTMQFQSQISTLYYHIP